MLDRQRLLLLAKDISPRYLIALYVVLVLAFGVGISSVVLYPQEARITELDRQLQQEKQKVAAVENFVLAHPDTEKYLADLQKSLLRAETALPGSVDVSIFMAQLEKDARASGVKLTFVKPSVVTDRAGYRELPVEVSVEGNFFATLSFLKKLEDGARFSIPASFLIQQKQNSLVTRLNIQIFCYGITPRPAVPAAAPGTPVAGPPVIR